MKPQLIIFYGGVDQEREVSLKSYDAITRALEGADYNIQSIEVTPEAKWLRDGKEVEVGQALLWADYAWIAGHGTYMEDGTLQRILDEHRVPYNGSDAISSQIAFSKGATKDLFEKHGIKTPTYKRYDTKGSKAKSIAEHIFRDIPQPCVIKPDRGGSSLGVSIAHTFEETLSAIEQAIEIGARHILAEEYIGNCEATVGVVQGMRDIEYYALPAVEIVPSKEFFDYEAKYEGAVEEICPSSFSDEVKQELEALAIRVHQILGLDDYSRTDFIIHPSRGIFVLEVNTLPGMANTSLLPQELEAVGITLQEFCEHIIARKI
ncbi:MAG: D-alanine--D-alanine ligase family protein [Patescibacteria group bacterium]